MGAGGCSAWSWEGTPPALAGQQFTCAYRLVYALCQHMGPNPFEQEHPAQVSAARPHHEPAGKGPQPDVTGGAAGEHTRSCTSLTLKITAVSVSTCTGAHARHEGACDAFAVPSSSEECYSRPSGGGSRVPTAVHRSSPRPRPEPGGRGRRPRFGGRFDARKRETDPLGVSRGPSPFTDL